MPAATVMSKTMRPRRRGRPCVAIPPGDAHAPDPPDAAGDVAIKDGGHPQQSVEGNPVRGIIAGRYQGNLAGLSPEEQKAHALRTAGYYVAPKDRT